jgi:hypothetical protein
MLMAACSDQELTPAVTAPGDGICLYATKLHLITRSGDVVARFATGTNYLLYALPHQDNTADYDWPAAKLYARPGTEADDATIDYGEVTSFSVGQPLDFYAAAVDCEDEKYVLPVSAYTTYAAVSDRVAPVVTWRDGYGKNSPSEGLGDLMVCTKIGATYEDGAVSLPFTHALTRFTFTVAKEDESGKADNSKFLEQVTLRKITLEGTRNCATYSLVDKMWTAAENSTVTRVVYDNATHINDKDSDGVLPNNGSLTTKFVEVPDLLMLFPNTLRLADGAAPTTELLTLKVQLHFPTWPSGADMNDAITEMQADGSYLVTVSFPLTVGNLTGETVTVTDANGKETSDLSTDPMSFVANSSYQLSILVTGDAIRILTIAPTVYEWIPQEVETTEAVVGTPVTMGGLMWMDRNLGAATYDAANDFYNSIGYYYQYGRNIPYILDVGKFVRFTYDDDGDSEDDNDANTSSSFITDLSQGYGPHIVKKTKATKDKDPILDNDYNNPCYYWYLRGKSSQLTTELKNELADLQEQCMYTFDHKGDTVWGILYEAGDNAFFNPGEKVYNEDGSVNDEETRLYHRIAVKEEEGKKSGSWRATGVKDRWLTLDNQPCPKGWRLPTHKDLYAIMPWGNRVQWGYRKRSITNNLTGETHTSSNLWWDYAMEHDGKNYGSYIYSDEGSAEWVSTEESPKKGWYRQTTASGQDTYGEFAGSVQEIRFGTKRKSDRSTYNVIYMLKWKGTDKAYRIRIMSHFAKAYGDSRYTTKDKTEYSKNKRYITISRYTAEKDKDIDYYVQNGNDETMWDNPIETLIYPCAGFLVTDQYYWDLRSFGEGLVLRTSESKGNSDDSWVQYLATATFNVSIENNSRRSLGDQIRCCRDISANY